jgi:hypothetical protein
MGIGQAQLRMVEGVIGLHTDQALAAAVPYPETKGYLLGLLAPALGTVPA